MKPQPIGTVWVARATLYDRRGHIIATCMDAPNPIAKAFMECPEATTVTQWLERKHIKRHAYESRMASWNVASSQLQRVTAINYAQKSSDSQRAVTGNKADERGHTS